MKPIPLIAQQLSNINEHYEEHEMIDATVFVGDVDGSHGQKSLAMSITDSELLKRDYEMRGRETIEQMINETTSSGDIDQVEPWLAESGQTLRVVGWIAWSVCDTEFFNLEWRKV